MTYEEIRCYTPINEVDNEKVTEIANSIKKNGWVGCPILVFNDSLLTGSHRLAALKKLYEELDFDELEEMNFYNMEVAEDVSDIVDENYDEAVEELGYCPEIDYRNIGWLLKNSWVEDYKDEINEW